MTLKNRPGVPVPGRPDAESGDTEVHSITDAAAAHSDEMRQRMIKYAIAMGIRMVCLILIFVVDGWFKLIPVAWRRLPALGGRRDRQRQRQSGNPQ